MSVTEQVSTPSPLVWLDDVRERELKASIAAHPSSQPAVGEAAGFLTLLTEESAPAKASHAVGMPSRADGLFGFEAESYVGYDREARRRFWSLVWAALIAVVALGAVAALLAALISEGFIAGIAEMLHIRFERSILPWWGAS